MKKVLAMILAAAMVLALCACGSTAAPAATEAPANIEPKYVQNSPLSTGRFPTNLPVWPFIAKVYLFPFHVVLSIHTG